MSDDLAAAFSIGTGHGASIHMTEAFVALGSNLGDRLGFLTEAVRQLGSAPEIRVRRVSSVYETKPVGFTNQPDFLNMALRLETVLEPLELLSRMQAVEQRLGRIRTIRWGPRTLDLDLLSYGRRRMADERLILPHPRMHERAFVLIPLLEILDPLDAERSNLEERLRRLDGSGKEEVKLWRTINWPDAYALTGN